MDVSSQECRSGSPGDALQQRIGDDESVAGIGKLLSNALSRADQGHQLIRTSLRRHTCPLWLRSDIPHCQTSCAE